MRESLIDGLHVLLHDLFAFAAVSVANRFANGLNGLLRWQYFRDGKEAHLQNGVHAAAHAGVAGDLIRVNHVKPGAPGNDLFLHGAWEAAPNFIRAKGTVQQERSAGNERTQHVVTFEEYPLVAGDKVGAGYQIAGSNRLRPESQVRNGDRTGLLRVIDEISLRVIVGILTDYLDRILIRAHGAVRAQAVEHGPDNVVGLGGERRVISQAGMADVVVDPDGEVILCLVVELIRFQIVVHRLDHGGSEFFGREAVPSTHDQR